MRGSQRQLVQLYRYRRGGEVRSPNPGEGSWHRGAFRFLARHSGASGDNEVQMKTSEAGWWDGRGGVRPKGFLPNFITYL